MICGLHYVYQNCISLISILVISQGEQYSFKSIKTTLVEIPGGAWNFRSYSLSSREVWQRFHVLAGDLNL